jgi:hypothetical protein
VENEIVSLFVEHRPPVPSSAFSIHYEWDVLSTSTFEQCCSRRGRRNEVGSSSREEAYRGNEMIKEKLLMEEVR